MSSGSYLTFFTKKYETSSYKKRGTLFLPVPPSGAFELAHSAKTSNEDPTQYIYTTIVLLYKQNKRVIYTK